MFHLMEILLPKSALADTLVSTSIVTWTGELVSNMPITNW